MVYPKRENFQKQDHQQMVILGSKNPLMVRSTEEAFLLAFGKRFLVQGLNIGSAEDTTLPIGDLDTYSAAFNKASHAKKAFPEADFWLGIEEGLDKIKGVAFTFAWIVVLDRNGACGRAKTASYFPKEGKGNIENYGLNENQNETSPLQKMEYDPGHLTNGLVNRKSLYIQAIFLGLIPFLP